MFTPLKNRALIEPDPKKQETDFGFLIPDNKEKPATGTVIVGNSDVKKGDKVLFSLFGLDEVTIKGKNYAVVSEHGILGIFHD